MADRVNPQITDSVTQSNANVVGGSPAQSMGLVYQTMAHSLSLTMQNAATAQNAMQQINAAVISTACRQIMSLPTQIAPTSPQIQISAPPPQSPPPSETPSEIPPTPEEDKLEDERIIADELPPG